MGETIGSWVGGGTVATAGVEVGAEEAEMGADSSSSSGNREKKSASDGSRTYLDALVIRRWYPGTSSKNLTSSLTWRPSPRRDDDKMLMRAKLDKVTGFHPRL